MRYAVLYPKGGVGKTTIAVHWATELTRRHGRTLLIDGDPNRTAADWAEWRKDTDASPSPITIQLRGNSIYNQGLEASAPYANAVVDLNGQDKAAVQSALLFAQRVIVPIQPTGFAASKVRDFLDTVETARIVNPHLEIRALIYGVHPSSSDADLREYLADRGVPTFEQSIRHRQVYGQATTDGLTVEEYRPRNAAAKHEMGKLYEEIERWQP